MRARLSRLWQVLLTAYGEFVRDSGPLAAGAIAFSSVLALVPIALLAITIIGYVVGSVEAYQRVADLLEQLLPGTSPGEASATVLTALREHTLAGGAFAKIVGVVGFLWAATNLFAVLSRVLTSIWVGAAQGGFWAHRLIGLLALLAGGALFVANIVLSSLLGALATHHAPAPSGLADLVHLFESSLPWVLNGVLVLAALFLFYRFLPQGRVTNQAALIGAAAATVLWFISRYVFSLLVAGSTRYGRVYGPLAGAVVLLLWIYYSAYIMLLCAELGVSVQERYWPAPPPRTGLM